MLEYLKCRWWLAGWLLAAVLLSACDDGSKTPAAPVSNWRPLMTSALTPVQTRQRAIAEEAKKEMFGKLMMELAGALPKGPGEAIPVCKQRAPQIATEIGAARGVKIGRTSWKLRNSRNAPPDWVKPLVENRPAEAVFAAAPDGTLGAVLPIRVNSMCLMCHGPADQLLPEVRDVLKANYPADQATGFKDGDLRGWFWVEVPKQP